MQNMTRCSFDGKLRVSTLDRLSRLATPPVRKETQIGFIKIVGEWEIDIYPTNYLNHPR